MDNNELNALRSESKSGELNRRDFVRVLTAASAAGAGLTAAGLTGFALTRDQRAEAASVIAADLGKLPRRNLGTRMGKMPVTAVCMSQDWNRDLIGPALGMGINFIHKAGYWNEVPAEIKALPRESYFTDITVDTTSPGHNPDNFDEAYNQVVQTLDRNGLKYYDIYRAHYGWTTVDKFKNKNVSYDVFKRLKREGKVKYFGVSQHPWVSYPEIIQAQIDSGIVDAMQVWFSYGYPKETEDVFARASKAGIGMTAMKINAHGRDKMSKDPQRMADLKAPGMVGRALLRDVMTRKRPDGKPIFHTCVTALGNMPHFEENIGAISPRVALADGFETIA